MQKLFIIIIIFINFQSWTKADDIRDFQIEGMSIGDSLLDFFSKKEIKPVKKDFKHSDDKSKNSIVKILQFDVSGGSIAVKYTNWSNTMNYSDNVTVDVNTIESDEWMMSNYGID